MKSRNINFQLSPILLPIIILIGPPGSGKTVVGQILANELNWQFWDTDALIETATGMKITDIFSKQGEPAFRFLEKTLLENILVLYKNTATKALDPAPLASLEQKKGTIISCGGGLPIPPQNFANLSKLGNIVYLNAPANILMARISHMKHRPLLDSKPDSELDAENIAITTAEQSAIAERLSRLESLINQRQEIYSQSQYKIDTADKNIETVVSDLRSLLQV